MTQTYCIQCDELVNTQIKTVIEQAEVKGEVIDGVETELLTCEKCGNIIYDFELEQKASVKIYNKYRQIHNLLMPEEITQIYKKYNLSAKSLAKILGFGDNTIYRYERGALQDKTHDALLKYINEPSFFLFYLLQNEVNISQKEKTRLINLLKPQTDAKLILSLATLKTKNSIAP